MADLRSLLPNLRFLLEAAHRAPSADNMQPWRFHVSGERLTLVYDPTRERSPIMGPSRHITLLSMGAVIENVAQVADASGVALEALEANPAGEPTVYFSAKMKSPGRASPEELRSHPLFRRQTNRHPYRSDPLPEDTVRALGALRQRGARVVAITDREMVRRLAISVRVASEARFRTRELHDWLMASLRATPEDVARGDGLDLRTLHLPPGGGLLLRGLADWGRMCAFNRVGGYRLLAGIEAGLLGKAPALLAVVGPARPADALDAGRLMERAWLLLTGRDVAAQPYYVLPEQLQRLADGKALPEFTHRLTETERAVRDALLLAPGEVLHMLLRVGYPKEAAVRSLRLPLESVVSIS